jgi:cellobiose transport system permease protein
MTFTVRPKAAARPEPTREASAPTPSRSTTRRSAQRSTLKPSWITYVLLSIVTFISVLPLYYTIVMASHTNAEMAAKVPPLLPNGSLFTNLKQALKLAPLNKGLINSVIVASCVTIGTVAFCTLGGFAFAKLRFRGSSALLGFCIVTMMVPTQMGIIPLYMLMARWGFAGHLQSVILPTLVTAFGLFFMRQYLSTAVPDELIEAAFVDGAGSFRVFWSVVVPAARPAMAILGMLTFLTTWNDFFWPIIALNSQNPTVQVAFQSLATGYAPQQSVIMAGTLYGTVPVLIVFAVLGRHIVGGIMQGAIKG